MNNKRNLRTHCGTYYMHFIGQGAQDTTRLVGGRSKFMEIQTTKLTMMPALGAKKMHLHLQLLKTSFCSDNGLCVVVCGLFGLSSFCTFLKRQKTHQIQSG